MKYIVQFWSDFLGTWCYYLKASSFKQAMHYAHVHECMYGNETRIIQA